MPLRSTIVGAATGVVLLAGVFGFAVGLPEVTGDEPEATDDGTEQGGNSKPVAELLPESLLNQALVRFKDLDPRYVAVADEFETYGAEKLTEAFGTDVATAVYVTPGLDAQAIVTLYDGESGLFLQDGPPEPPAMSGGQRPIADVVRQGDSVCIAQWEPQSYEQDGAPFQAQCQRVVGGVTVNVYTTPGLSIEQTADLVDDVVDQADLE